jgi:hypothetical protein
MPTHRPKSKGYDSGPREWHARAKRDDIDFSLGYYRTREEACEAERAFAERNPQRCRQVGKNQRDT